jgi:hypothetical protein
MSSSSSSVPATETTTTPRNNRLQKKDTTLHQTGASVAADMTRRMVCGGLAGMVAKTATNPLERIKMLSQTGEHGLQTAGVVDLYRSIIRNEGILGLWAGNGANLLRIFPAKAIVFSANDMYRGVFRRLSKTSDDKNLPAYYAFFAGGFAGMSASACTYPLDFARGRISGKLASHGSQKEYRGIIRTVVVTVKDEGFLALYKGVTPTLVGALPYEGIKFGTVAVMEHLFPSEQTTPIRKMLFGGLGGVMAGLITYPNDTVRRLLQLQGSRGSKTNYTGYWDVVRKTYKAEGIARFYRGVLINIVRMAPNAAVQFGSYEVLKNLSKEYF